MMMILHDVQQGTPEWLTLRRNHFTASEAPAMMGESPYMTRSELLRRKATGIEPEIDGATARRFQAGHDAEAAYRPLAEDIVGEELYPITGSVEIEGLSLLASFDGLTMDDRIGFEHKLWHAGIADTIAETGEPPPAYFWQLEQQLLVSGAERILFVTSDGEADNCAWCWYVSRPERRAALIAGWKQFAADLAEWQPEKAAPPKPSGRAPETLPALRIEVSGHVTASNLSEFKANALAVLAGINRDLQTDADFADAEQTVKWCGEVEDRIAAAKAHALSQTASIEEAFRTLDDVSAEVRRVRLDLDKLIKAEKDKRRKAIVFDGIDNLSEHIKALNDRIGKPLMPAIAADFAGAVKGRKNLGSMKDAVAAELARAKIEASAIADRIQINLKRLQQHQELSFLFPDVKAIVLKEPADVAAIVAGRLAEHEAKERARLEAERQRIATEERARIEAEERARAEVAVRDGIIIPQPAVGNTGSHGSVSMTHLPEAVTVVEQPAAATVQSPACSDEKPTLRLGQINERLAPVSIDTAGLAKLGFPHAATDKAAKLYHERDWPAICRAIAAWVIEAAAEERQP